MDGFNTPILFLIFNRFDTTKQVFEMIRKIAPLKLYIAADGPRDNREGEEEKIKTIREYVLNSIDWDCEVKTLFREKNLGCRKAVSMAITWFFENEEMGIILEDDCLPTLSFFSYCEELLNKYKDDTRIYHIAGYNPLTYTKIKYSYYFARIQHCWGWASWRRAWEKYSFDINDFIEQKKINKIFTRKADRNYWINNFKDNVIDHNMEKQKINAWGYQWTYAIMNNNGICINPSRNLITNIGFGVDATHTTNDDPDYSNQQRYEISEIIHPKKIKLNKKLLNSINEIAFGINTLSIYRWFVSKIKRFISKIKNCIKRVLFVILDLVILMERNIVRFFPVSNIVLIIRPDNIGDYVLFRNMIQELAESQEYHNFQLWLIGNHSVANLAMTLDKKYIKKFIWVNHDWYNQSEDFNHFNFKYKRHVFEIKTKLHSKKYHSIIYPVFSRCTCYDKLCQSLLATNKITMNGDNVNMIDFISLYECVYTKIISVQKDPGVFEFYRNREFFSSLLKKHINQIRPSMDKKLLPSPNLILPQCYAVFHTNASADVSIWPQENFMRAADYIYQKYNLPIVLLGYSNDVESLKKLLPASGVINLYNKTTLSESAAILAKSALFIGNDSGLLHIAAAVGVQKIICLCKGNYYGRFVPYPSFLSEEEYYFVFPPVVESELGDEYLLKRKYADGRYEDIKTISLTRVLELIDKLLSAERVD